jgi:two-component system, OmpR family, sensor kinase
MNRFTAPRRWSLTWRLVSRLMIGTGIGWLLITVVSLYVLWHEIGELYDEGLAREAALVLDRVMETGVVPSLPDDEMALRVTGPGIPTVEAPWAPLTADGAVGLRGWEVYRKTSPTGYAVELGQTWKDRRDEFMDAARAFLLLILPVLLLLPLLVHITTKRALAPARQFAEMMARRDAADISPVAEGGLPDELQPIPHALNQYLERLDGLLRAERNFAANAAHELKTPLAAASAQLQLYAAGMAGPDALHAVAGSVDRMAVMVSRLLELARAEAGIGKATMHCDLLRVLRLVIAEMPPGRIVLDDGDAETLLLPVDPDALAILLRNLIDNALHHGTGAVRVVLRAPQVLEIRNPVAPGATFQEARFVRGAGSTGSGLGLSIARAIAAQLGWGLSLTVAGTQAIARIDLPTPGLPALLPGLAPTLAPHIGHHTAQPRATVDQSVIAAACPL